MLGSYMFWCFFKEDFLKKSFLSKSLNLFLCCFLSLNPLGLKKEKTHHLCKSPYSYLDGMWRNSLMHDQS